MRLLIMLRRSGPLELEDGHGGVLIAYT
jgi:hypothetical protein